MITVVRTANRVTVDNHPDAGMVAIEAPVNARTFGAIAHTLFDALGQTSAATGNRVNTTRDQLPLLTVALMARAIRVVVVDHAQRCGISSLTQLIHTTFSADAELVAVLHPPIGDHVERALAAWPHRHESLDNLTGRLQRRTAESAPLDPPTPPFPRVPDTEFPHFLADCHRTLSPDDYQAVDAEYRRLLSAVRAETESDPTGPGVLESLRRHMHDATSADHAVTIVRAGTAAAFPSGLFVTCPADQLRAAIAAEPYFRARSHTDWRTLHTYRRPERAAVAVLAAIGLTAAQICELTIADADHLDTQLPPLARPHLRRVALHRDITGAERSDPLITLADGRSTTPRWVREALLDIGRSTELPADRQRRRPIHESEYQWSTRLGIRVRSL